MRVLGSKGDNSFRTAQLLIIGFRSKAILIATGTFLGGEIFLGNDRWHAGRIGEKVSIFSFHMMLLTCLIRVSLL